MIKYAKVIDEQTGLCEVGLGTNIEFYKSIGMVKLDVEQSDINNNWYLIELCPHKTDEEKLQEAKEAKYQEANTKAREYLESGEADFELSENIHIEATKENMNSLATASIAIEKGLIEYQAWTSKEDNLINLNQEQCLTISMGIGAIQSDVWNRQFINYKEQIEGASTVEEAEGIEIDYSLEVQM